MINKIVLFLLLLSLLIVNSSFGEEINWEVISNGVVNGQASTYSMKGTVSQTAIGWGSFGEYGMHHGFWQKFDANMPCQGECGNADNSGPVDISDAVYLINLVFVPESPEPKPVRACGDADSNGQVDISDAVFLINLVFVAGSPLPGDCAPSDPDWINGDCCPYGG